MLTSGPAGPRSRSLRVLVLAACLGCALAASSCSADPDAEKERSAETAAASGAPELDLSAFPEDFRELDQKSLPVAIDKALNRVTTYATRTQSIVDGQSGQAKTADVQTRPQAMRAVLGPGPEGKDTVGLRIGTTYYVKNMGAERPWWKVDPKVGVGSTMEQTIDLADPSKPLAAIGRGQGTEAIGGDAVDGVPSAVYQTRVDPEDYYETIGLSVGPSVALPSRDVDLVVWVARDGRPLKLQITAVVQGQTGSSVTTYGDWDAAPRLSAPPPAQVTTKQPALGG